MALNVSKSLLKAKSLARRGDLQAAARLFTAVLEQFPQNRQAAQGLASLHRTQGAPVQELQHLVSVFNRGELQRALQLGQALERRFPGEPLVHNVLGATYKSLRNYDSAIASLSRAVRLRPDYAEAYSNLGAAYHDTGNYEAAVANYSSATRCDPGMFEAYYNLGNALAECGRPEEAVASYAQAVRIEPDFAMARGSLLFQLAQVCDWDALQSHAASVPTLGVAGASVHPFALLHVEDNPARHRQRAETYARTTYPQRELPPLARPDLGPARLRVGYFSADFHEHATMYLMARLFELHDRDAFVIHAYSYGAGDSDSDSMRRRLIAAVDEFHDVRNMEDAGIAELARSHQLDVAVDLKGYTQHSRLGIFSCRVAPVQIAYLGYPGTTGAPFIDYLIADRVVIPAEQRVHYSERIIYLPDSYQVNDSGREISERVFTREELGLPEQAFVFCCFNNNFKIGPGEFDIWMRLLQQVEGSVLWLFGSSPGAEANLRKQAQKRGVAAGRLVFARRLEHAEHLARHRLADLFLDTFNYNAHTTASDALWAGLPVVTMAGQGFAARVAASLLRAVDLAELVTGSRSEYEQLALALARDPGRLRALRTRLLANRHSAPLFDTRAFTRHIEEAYRRAWQNQGEGRPADTIEIRS